VAGRVFRERKDTVCHCAPDDKLDEYTSSKRELLIPRSFKNSFGYSPHEPVKIGEAINGEA